MGKSKNLTQDKNYWFVGDFETITANTNFFKLNGHSIVNLWGLQKYGDFKNYEINVGMDSFLEFIFNLKRSATIWFHKLDFDGNFIVKWLLQKSKFKMVGAKDKKIKQGFYFFKQNTKIFNIVIRNVIHYINEKTNKRVAKNIKIIFRCSLKLLSAGVESLGKDLNITKHENNKKTFYDYEEFNHIDDVPLDFINYLKRDIEIVNRSLTNFENVIDEFTDKKLNCLNQLTAGSLSMKIYKTIFLSTEINYNGNRENDQYLYLKDEEEYNFGKFSYYGGWTQFNKSWQGSHDVIGNVYDIVSSYPYSMTKFLPYGKLYDEKPSFNDYTTWVYLEIKEASIKEKYKDFLILKNWNHQVKERYCSNLKDFKCVYNLEEWDFINEVYDFKIKYIAYKYQKTYPFLNYYIDKLFKLKQDYKKQNKKAYSLGIKILLNATYGKLTQRNLFERMIYTKELFDKNQLISIDDQEYKVLRQSKAFQLKNFNTFFLEPQKEIDKFNNVFAASYVTSQSRLKLWKQIAQNKISDWGYSDTDSIFMKKGSKVNVIGENLGDWEKGPEFKKSIITGAKRYALEFTDDVCKNECEVGKCECNIKIAFAGVQKSQRDILNLLNNMDYNNFADGENEIILHIENAKLQWVEDDFGITLQNKDLDVRKGLN